ncbi:ribbon-helix-helix domain-containing protein [Salegentibacter sp. HM20]
MKRQSISITSPNDNWLKKQVESEEFSSKSELINHLIRRAREKEESAGWLREKLIEGEQSGFTNLTKEEILKQSKTELRKSGKL